MNDIDIEAAKKFIATTSDQTSVYVACDSIVSNSNTNRSVIFAVTIVVHLDTAKGARVFSGAYTLPYMDIKQRLLKEVEFAVTTALELCDCIGNRKLQVHLDLSASPKNVSNTVAQEALGWVRGAGLTPVIKPDTMVINSADRRVRQINYSR